MKVSEIPTNTTEDIHKLQPTAMQTGNTSMGTFLTGN
uniref:Uncharacterized protein n=1 Tax=Anguilla anguilla TaxID=7936 RepID=A0A0E9PZK2_ANGAN